MYMYSGVCTSYHYIVQFKDAQFCQLCLNFYLKNFFCVCAFFRDVPEAYESSQARGLIGAAAAGLYHSHSYAGS